MSSWPLLAVVATLPLALASPVRPGAETSAPTRLVFEVTPAVDLFFHVRTLAADASASVPAEFAPAVEAVRALDKELGGFSLAWGPVEGLLPGCKGAADVEAAFARAPETFELRPGQNVGLRAGALRIAAALKAVEPAFLTGTWPAHERAIQAARARLAQGFEPKEAACLAYHMKSLGMSDPELAIPVYLTMSAPFPGAVTHRGEGGRGVCFVAIEGPVDMQGSLLFETVLHEATHALDVASEASVLEDLREALGAAGLTPRERAFRDVPHTLMFVQAAESIRRTVVPDHVDYGVASDYYARIGPSAESVRELWHDHLEEKLTRAEAVAEIVRAVAPPK